MPIKGLSIAKPTNCGKGTAVRGVTRSGKNGYKLEENKGKLWTCDSNISSVSHRASLTLRGFYKN